MEPPDPGPRLPRNNYFTEMCSSSQAGSHLRLIDICITQPFLFAGVEPPDPGARLSRPLRRQGITPHGGLRTFHQKSTCLHAINFIVKFGHVAPEKWRARKFCRPPCGEAPAPGARLPRPLRRQGLSPPLQGYLAHKKLPPPQDHRRALGMGLL